MTTIERESTAGSTFVRTAPVSPSRMPSRRPTGSRPTLSRWLTAGIAFSVVLLTGWFALYLYFVSGIQHARSQHELYADYRSQLAQRFAPVGGEIPFGAPVAMISIPKAGVK